MNDKKEKMIRRPDYERQIMPFVATPLVKVISGIRRCGKSSVLQLLAQAMSGQRNEPASAEIVYLNMESLTNDRYKDIYLLDQYVRDATAALGKPVKLFIDEIQEIPEWERVVNSLLADGQADIYVSGSNSRLLSGELATYLSGRYVEFSLFPLVFEEYMTFDSQHPADLQRAFMDFIKYGGMPGIHRLQRDPATVYQYLGALVDSVLLQDVIMRHKVRDVALLRSLLLFLADNCGNIFSARSISDYLKKERRSLGVETIYNYLGYLESAFVVYKVPRYDLRGKRLLETHEKYYLADLGLRHALLGYREADIGVYLENIVYIELRRRGYELAIGKLDEYEIDFVASKGNQRMYIQVAYLLADQNTREREFRPLRMINDNYPKYVLTMDAIPAGNDEGIIRMGLVDWLLVYKPEASPA